MPKGKGRKSKKSSGQAGNSGADDLFRTALTNNRAPSVIDDMSDTESVMTSYSEHLSEDCELKDVQSELNSIEVIESKLAEAVDGLTEKSSKYRMGCINKIRQYFLATWLTNFLDRFQETLIDGLEKCLKKGGAPEQALAAETLAVVTLQLSCGDIGEDLYHRLNPILIKLIKDQTTNTQVRTKCCLALGVLAFVVEEDVDSLNDCMTLFQSVFSGSLLKGDKSVPVLKPLVGDLHVAALSSWGLLLTVCPWSRVEVIADALLAKLPQLLSSNEVNVRIQAGVVLALFYEIIRNEENDQILTRHINTRQLVTEIRGLATDGSKHRSKKDRRYQRAIFRDVLLTLEHHDTFESTVKFGSEVLELSSWTLKVQYDVFKSILKTGLSFHLGENRLLRDIFSLGPVRGVCGMETGQRKRAHFERHLMNEANFKVQSQARNKCRDKRVANYD